MILETKPVNLKDRLSAKNNSQTRQLLVKTCNLRFEHSSPTDMCSAQFLCVGRLSGISTLLREVFLVFTRSPSIPQKSAKIEFEF